MRNLTKTKVIVQGFDESANEFSKTLNESLEKISIEFPESNPICIPTSSSNGRTTVLIQWNFQTEPKPDNIMLVGLATVILSKLKLEQENDNRTENNTKIIVDEIRNFLNR